MTSESSNESNDGWLRILSKHIVKPICIIKPENPFFIPTTGPRFSESFVGRKLELHNECVLLSLICYEMKLGRLWLPQVLAYKAFISIQNGGKPEAYNLYQK